MTSTGTRAEVEQLTAEGLAGLREHPEPLLTERFACMLGVPPSLVEASASDTTAIIEILEEDGGPEALAVLLALDRLIVAKWARGAAARSGRSSSSPAVVGAGSSRATRARPRRRGGAGRPGRMPSAGLTASG